MAAGVTGVLVRLQGEGQDLKGSQVIQATVGRHSSHFGINSKGRRVYSKHVAASAQVMLTSMIQYGKLWLAGTDWRARSARGNRVSVAEKCKA